ncbi:ATP-dependent RNA helicase DDX54-like [Dendronephthya gigantea]|uniref:ATP-dependent RNA helicase DDX54-like n=1 Tax=Dendronephthya gigantea TaxID=151771 RepID=UPI00106B396E|nr:ATP-dependent RNA helicase DDX54-like [Dendronephthya gigantea]
MAERNKSFVEDEDGNFEVSVKKMVASHNRKKKKSGGFQVMGLSYPVYKGIMKKGYKVPTPIQRKAIPLILDGKDVVAMARTGSGKTAAFLVPMFEKLHGHSAKTGARALILSPTRELALQTLKFTKELGRFTDLKSAVILGGDRMDNQFSALHENPDVVIATPGRFLHVIMEMDLKLTSIEYVVFDEADRLFEMGFSEQLHEIISRLPEARQTLLFSATLPKSLVEFAKAGLNDPTLLRLDVDTKLSEQLKLAFFSARADDKNAVLLHLLQSVIKPTEQTMIFAATRHHVEFLKTLLALTSIPCSYVYSALDQAARKINVAKFRKKKCMVLITTDVAARGIDIPMLDNVINYNFPAQSKLFVHRVGRVARAGRIGTAYSIIAPDEVAYMLDLCLFLGRPLKTARESYTENDDKDFVYGRVPQDIIDEQEDTLRNIHQNTDAQSEHETCTKAYKQYSKSRPAPSPESVKRTKEMSLKALNCHPLLGGVQEVAHAKFLDGVRSYKAKQTIFEIGATSKTRSQDIMRLKRRKHGTVIEKNKQQMMKSHEDKNMETRGSKVEETTQDEIKSVFTTVMDPSRKTRRPKGLPQFRDENYIPHRAPDHFSERGLGINSFQSQAENAVLDLDADEAVGLTRTQNNKRWDRKRKKFVGKEENTKKRIKTESGRWIPASYKTTLYKDWLDKNAVKHQKNEDDNEDSNHPGTFRKGKKRGRRKDGRLEGRKNELRNKEQILKQRKRKQNILERQKKGREKNIKKKQDRNPRRER